jgi:DNA-binding HxlR family transcriptional regulator
MQRKSFCGMNCSIARALEEVGEWWSLLIVRECTQGSHRFDEFQKELGIARNVLTSRLARLIEVGVLEKFPLAERANTDGYRLTPKGEELYPVLVALHQWGDKWLAPEGKPRVHFVDNAAGELVAPVAVRSASGQPLSFRDVRFVEGPGAKDTTRAVIADRNKRVLGLAEAERKKADIGQQPF